MKNQNVKEFKNIDELNKVIFKRARAILGFRGFSKSERICVCTNSIRHIGLKVTDDQIAEIAIAVANDTAYHTIQYF